MAGPFPGVPNRAGRRLLLTELLTADRVRVPLVSTGKDAVLEELVRVLEDEGVVADRAAALRAVRQREEVLSTGIGGGVAIPHGKSDAVPELAMAAGVASAPMEFASLDGAPVQLFFLLVGPESAAGLHVKALSRISRLVRREETRARLAAAESPAAFMAIVAEAEAE